MEQLNGFKDDHPLRYGALLIGMGMLAGFGYGAWAPVGEQRERVVTKEVTPQACHDVLALDDEIFMTLGEHLGQYDFAGATDYIGGVRAERLSLYAGCVGA